MTKMSTPQAALLVSQTVCRDSSINGRLSCRVPLACFELGSRQSLVALSQNGVSGEQLGAGRLADRHHGRVPNATLDGDRVETLADVICRPDRSDLVLPCDLVFDHRRHREEARACLTEDF